MKEKEKWARDYVKYPIDSVVEQTQYNSWLAGFDFAKSKILGEILFEPDNKLRELGESEVSNG